MSEEQVQETAAENATAVEETTPPASAKEEMKEKAKKMISEAKEKATEISKKSWFGPVTASLAGGLLVVGLLMATDHLIWTKNGPRLISVNDAYLAGKNRGIKDIENMPWYSRIWRGFTGDYHSK